MQALRIILLCILAAIAYGLVHDQITAHLCVEYFSIGHPRVIDSESPATLGLVWGVIATWWAGAIIGVGLAASARVGHRPELPVAALVLPVAKLLALMAALATLAGFTGYFAASRDWVFLLPDMATAVPKEAHVRFITCLWTHVASYAVGFLGGAVLCVKTWRRRGGLAIAASPSSSLPSAI